MAKPMPPCPFCGSKRVAPILYGMPTAEDAKGEDEGKYFLGGCCIDDDSPDLKCKDCERSWQRRTAKAPPNTL